MISDIAVTGIGIKCPLGLNRRIFWENCQGAQNALTEIDRFDTTAFQSNIAGCVENFDPKEYLPSGKYRRMGLVSKLAVAASIEAIEDSELLKDKPDRDQIAIILGTAYGSTSSIDMFFESLLKDGPRGTQPFFFPETVPNAPASHIAMIHGITGPNTTFSQNLVSAESAIMYGCQLLMRNQANAVLAGGADEVSALQYTGFNAIGALNKMRAIPGRPVTPQPGGGMVLGEGAGILILERMDTAVKRGARVYGCIKAVNATGGASAMGHYDLSGTQTTRAIADTLREADLTLKNVDQISVSANYTKELDMMEYRSLSAMLTESKTDIGVIPLKYLMGDFGGAGAIRAAAAILSLYYRQPLPEIYLAFLESGHAENLKWHRPDITEVNTVLMTSSTFGGGSCCSVFTSQFPS